MTSDLVLIEHRGAVMTITLNRPETLNALIAASYAELDRALLRAADPSIRAVIVTGAGRGFCTGQDMSASDGDDPAADLRFVDSTVRALHALQKPTIAVINGAAAGGGLAYALACDYRIASSQARLVPAFLDMGLVPDLGCSWFLVRLLGYPRAIEWLLSGRRLGAEEALAWGLVSEVVEPDLLTQRAADFAAALAAGPTLAIGLAKRLLNRAQYTSLDEQLGLEADAQVLAGASADYREALAAFREKRKPGFGGR